MLGAPNEAAGEYFTPREVMDLMVGLLFIEDDDEFAKLGIVKAVPANRSSGPRTLESWRNWIAGRQVTSWATGDAA